MRQSGTAEVPHVTSALAAAPPPIQPTDFPPWVNPRLRPFLALIPSVSDRTDLSGVCHSPSLGKPRTESSVAHRALALSLQPSSGAPALLPCLLALVIRV